MIILGFFTIKNKPKKISIMSFLGRAPKCSSRAVLRRCCAPSRVVVPTKQTQVQATTQAHDGGRVDKDHTSVSVLKEFRRRDTDQDGFLTLEEYSVGRARGRPRTQDTRRMDKTIFDKYDADGDNLLSPSEYSRLDDEIGNGGLVLLGLAFASVDEDGDGIISGIEFFRALRGIFVNVSVDLLNRLDVDDDDMLSLRDFQRGSSFNVVSIDPDGDGRVQLDDFLDAVFVGGLVDERRDLLRMFNEQRDRDNTVSISQATAMLEIVGQRISRDSTGRFTAAFDIDRDGLVAADEFLNADTDGDMRVSANEYGSYLYANYRARNPFLVVADAAPQ
jgi:Ca2+-binding EF-hand superfamily protein